MQQGPRPDQEHQHQHPYSHQPSTSFVSPWYSLFQPVPAPSTSYRPDRSTGVASNQRPRFPPAGAMTDPWEGAASLMQEIAYLRVDGLKFVIKEVNLRHHSRLRTSGRKDELIQRLRGAVTESETYDDPALYRTIRDNVTRARAGSYTPASSTTTTPSTASTTAGTATASGSGSGQTTGQSTAASTSTSATTAAAAAARAPAPTYDLGNKSLTNGASGSGSGTHATGPASAYSAPPRFTARPPQSTGLAPAAAAGTGGWGRSTSPAAGQTVKRPFSLHFQTSPFYRLDEPLTTVMTCQKAGQGERKVATLTISLNNDQRQKLLDARNDPRAAQYQARLFCTSEDHYASALAGSGGYQRPVLRPAPTDYPPTCEVRINDVMVPGNTRGIKKQPGTAVPPDLGKAKSERGTWGFGLHPGGYNRVELVYANTEKRYYIVALMVEYTPVQKLMATLNEAKVRSKQEVLDEINRKVKDDDIVMSSSACDLRDPLSMMRIVLPARSTSCSHLACFDAQTFLEMMEQTPTWKCPICNKTISLPDLFVDGYMKEILDQAPKSVDSVVIEADGTWRDEQSRFGTAPSVLLRRAASTGGGGLSVGGGGGGGTKGASSLPSPAPTSGEEKGKRKRTEEPIALLDGGEDDDDEDRTEDEEEDRPLMDVNGAQAKKQRLGSPISVGSSPRRPSSTNANRGPPVVIDLTFD